MTMLGYLAMDIADNTLVCDLQELIDEYAERIRKAVEHG